MLLYVGVLCVVMDPEITIPIASSGIYEKKELINKLYNDMVRYMWENKAGNFNIMSVEGGGISNIALIGVGIVW